MGSVMVDSGLILEHHEQILKRAKMSRYLTMKIEVLDEHYSTWWDVLKYEIGMSIFFSNTHGLRFFKEESRTVQMFKRHYKFLNNYRYHYRSWYAMAKVGNPVNMSEYEARIFYNMLQSIGVFEDGIYVPQGYYL